jgi:hypothetical protein
MAFDRRRLLLGLSLGLAGPTAWAKASEPTPAKDDLPFRLELPPGFELKARPRGPDFIVYDVMKGEVGYVGIYYGGYPGFPMAKDAKVSKGANPTIQVARSVRADGAPRVEYLIKNKDGWGVLHVWTQNPSGDQTTAERIAASVRFK